MPVSKVDATADALTMRVHEHEAAGERIIAVLPWANDFLVVTEPSARKAAAPAAQRETRATTPKAKA